MSLTIKNQEWSNGLSGITSSDSFKMLSTFVLDEYKTKIIFPKQENIFRALTLTPLSKVSVVILGQDPYHDDGQAEGLAFSVPSLVKVPPSLRNIYKEIISDLCIEKDLTSGSLVGWTQQGVLLLNTTLTVVAHTPASHAKKGWEDFSDSVIKLVSDKKENVVFMLWGNHARSKRGLIDESKHLVLEAAHPSPLSAHSGFFGCRHFSGCNEYLSTHKKREIIW